MLIGWQPNSKDFSHPADRRKLLFFLDKKGLQYEIAQYEKHYEVLYLSLGIDLGKWANYKSDQLLRNKNTRVVFDLSDSYLKSGFISDRVRPLYHFLVGRTSSLDWSYKTTLIKMMSSADVVVCGSVEQKTILDSYHENVVVIRDYFGKDIRLEKLSYEMVRSGELHLLWEGFSHGNKRVFYMLRDVLEKIKGLKIHLHVITDQEYCSIGAKHFCKSTYAVLNKIFSNSLVQFHLYDWSPVTFSSIATSCDIALIPIPDDPIMYHKPENKLLLLWSLGVPVITSSTPSYSRVFSNIGENMLCKTKLEWTKKITELISTKYRREEYMSAAFVYLKEHCTDEVIMKSWEHVLFGDSQK